ncbi:hypothetical protein ACIA59_28850 [Micromonospora haikouensis]|uniref:hypothetical protein n=1 Tax=Micromonospora haikouensis TaxID=686309 RepID=UPI00379C3766
MASRTGNEATRALRQRQEVERRAMRAVEQAAGAVEEASKRRREALARLDGEAASAAAEHGLAVAVLATVLRDDGLAADLTGLDVPRVRACRRGADSAAVRSRIAALGAAVPRRRRTAVPVPEEAAPPVGEGAGGDSMS